MNDAAQDAADAAVRSPPGASAAASRTGSAPAGVAMPEVEAAGGWDLDNDALAHALSWLSQHHGRPRSPHSLLAGQPIKGLLQPEQALRVLREAGFSAGLVQRPIGELNALLLPAVLRRQQGRWLGVTSFRSAFWNVASMVTAFTIAHSITLSLATLGVVNLPSRLVESAIALSCC